MRQGGKLIRKGQGTGKVMLGVAERWAVVMTEDEGVRKPRGVCSLLRPPRGICVWSGGSLAVTNETASVRRQRLLQLPPTGQL